MNLKELRDVLEKRRIMLERKLDSKKKPHYNGVDPDIIIEIEAKLEEIERILDLIYKDLEV
jgi:hypothetical protein